MAAVAGVVVALGFMVDKGVPMDGSLVQLVELTIPSAPVPANVFAQHAQFAPGHRGNFQEFTIVRGQAA